MSEEGRQQFNAATARIYALPESQWHGRWCIALLNGIATKKRAAVRQQLSWLGFGQLGADTLAHPHPDRTRLHRHLDNLGVRNQTILLDAAPAEGESDTGLRQLVSEAWDLGALEAAYAAGSIVVGKVLEVVKGGLAVDVGARAFLPASRSGEREQEGLEAGLIAMRRGVAVQAHEQIGPDLVGEAHALGQVQGLVALAREQHLGVGHELDDAPREVLREGQGDRLLVEIAVPRFAPGGHPPRRRSPEM